MRFSGVDHFNPFVRAVAEASHATDKKRKGAAQPKVKKAKQPAAPAGGADLSPLTPANIVGRRVLVVAELWPDYVCAENGGAGWSCLVVHAGKGWADVRFLEARDGDGKPYKDERLTLDVLRPL